VNAKLITIVLGSVLFAACGGGSAPNQPPASNTPRPETAASVNQPSAALPPEAGGASAAPGTLGDAAARAACQQIDTGDSPIVPSQTFAINFEPFKDSCFVTTHNPEYDDPPMEASAAIYKDGKKVFDLPDQFRGTQAFCGVDAVGFQDLNADSYIDVIIIGRCQAKMGDYFENMVYANTGKTLTTNVNASIDIGEMSTVRAVAEYVKKNPAKFFAN
jgi:hypothetical protein